MFYALGAERGQRKPAPDGSEAARYGGDDRHVPASGHHGDAAPAYQEPGRICPAGRRPPPGQMRRRGHNHGHQVLPGQAERTPAPE